MTPFLVATLLALLAGGALALVWRLHRPLFTRALAAVIALAVAIGAYAWWVSHGYELGDDAGTVTLADLRLEPVAGSYRLQGVATNTSKTLAVSALPIALRVEDCAGSSCRRLFDDSRPLVISLAPGETRRFVLVYNADPVTVQGILRWRASPGAARTYRPVPR